MMWRVFVIACCVSAERQLARPRVYHGQEDTNKEFPFVVSLEHRDGSRICTCSLIAENWVITAAHCAKKRSRRIKYADMTSNNTKSYSKIIEVFSHPGYFVSKMLDVSVTNDLALVLIEKVPNPVIAKLSAIDYKALTGLPVKYAGFGRTGKEISYLKVAGDNLRSLQVGEALVIPCPPGYPMFGPAICIAPKCSNRFQDARRGDAGGPLLYRGKIVGVIIGSERFEPVSYVTPVSSNLDWISSVMKKHNGK